MKYLVVALLLTGAYATSFAEYKLNYNLFDFTRDKIVAVLKFVHLAK